MEFTSFEGDMTKEEEERVMEELAQARDEIKRMKMRQAMVSASCFNAVMPRDMTSSRVGARGEALSVAQLREMAVARTCRCNGWRREEQSSKEKLPLLLPA